MENFRKGLEEDSPIFVRRKLGQFLTRKPIYWPDGPLTSGTGLVRDRSSPSGRAWANLNPLPLSGRLTVG